MVLINITDRSLYRRRSFCL